MISFTREKLDNLGQRLESDRDPCHDGSDSNNPRSHR